MPSYNKVMVMGNLTRDVELKSIKGGASVCELGLAVNEKYKKSNGEYAEETVYVDVVVWGKTAEHCANYLHKGSLVFVDARLKMDVWKSKDGKDMQKLKIVCETIKFLDPKPSGGGNRNQQSNSSNDRGRDNDEPPVF